MIAEAKDTRPTWARSWQTDRRDLAAARARIAELETELAVLRRNGKAKRKPRRRATNGQASFARDANGLLYPLYTRHRAWQYKSIFDWISRNPGSVIGEVIDDYTAREKGFSRRVSPAPLGWWWFSEEHGGRMCSRCERREHASDGYGPACTCRE